MRFDWKKAAGIVVMSALLTGQAFASEFVEPESYSGLAPEVFQQISKSSVRYRLENGAYCTGTWISNEGHLLTAFHCLVNPLKGKIKLNPDMVAHDSYAVRFPGDNRNVKINKINALTFSEPLALIHHDGKTLTGLEARVVSFAGAGWIEPFDLPYLREANPKLLQQLREQGIRGTGDLDDIVVLKVSRTAGPLNHTAFFQWPPKCSPLNFTRPVKTEELFSLSFPLLERIKSYSPFMPLFTRGETIEISEIEPNLRQLVESHFPGQEFIFNTLDAEGGSSGSATYDQTGFVRGITIMTYARSDRYYQGRTISLPVSRILPYLDSEVVTALCEGTRF